MVPSGIVIEELLRQIQTLLEERDWLRGQLDEWGSALGAALAKKPPVEAILQGDLEAHKPGTWDYLCELEKVCRAASAARTESIADVQSFHC